MKEKRDLYNNQCELTDKTYYKGDHIPSGYYPMVVMVAIQNSKGEFLMQKRVPKKGGDWGVTGGHPKSGQTCEQGTITEIKEELGIDITEDMLQSFCMGCDGTDCYKMYYIKLDLDIDKFVIQKDELTEVQWFSIDKLKNMVKKKELNPNQIDFFDKCMTFLNNDKQYYVKHIFPTNKEIIKLFNSVGWIREEKRVDENRKNTFFTVCIYEKNEIVAMGRVVGDGTYFTIYDIVVDKQYQSKGLGKIVMQEIVDWYKCIKDSDTFLYVNASKNKEGFYEKFGFRERPNEDVGSGMKWHDE